MKRIIISVALAVVIVSTINVFIISIILLSCSSNDKSKISGNTLNLDYNIRHDIQLSDYIDSVKIVKLETSNDVLIGGFVRNVQIFDDKLFILDCSSSSLFIFTGDGKFIHKIYSVGQGPGEYFALFDCYADKRGIYLLGSGIQGNIIFCYDWNYNYIRTISLGHQYLATSFTSDGEYFWLYTEPGGEINNQVIVADSAGKIINRFLEHYERTKENWASSNTLLKYNDVIYFSSRYGNTIYKWNKNSEWEEFITISAGKKTYNGNINNLDALYNPEFPYLIRRYYLMLNDWFVFNFYAEEEIPLFCFHNLKTKQTETGKIKSDLIPGFSRFYPVFQSGNFLIDLVMIGDIIHDYPELCDFDISLKNPDEEDNPVLIIYKIR
jgi:hypothetical protein